MTKQTKITIAQRNMLSKLQVAGRNILYFATSHHGRHAMAPDIAQKNLDYLVKHDLVYKDGDNFCITVLGRRKLQGETFVETAPYEKYVPAPWNIRAGAGQLSTNGRCA